MPLISSECQKYDIRYVANYLRKSRAESLEDLEKHRMVLNELCQKRGYKYVEFLEIGTSDSLELRPKMSKLLKEIEDDTYDAVCVIDYDRLSRGDMGDQDRIAKTFRKSETLIVTPDKIYDLNDDIDDEMVEFKGFMARREYKMITKRLRQGKRIGAKQGQWTNGKPPFPYVYQKYMDKYNEKGIVVDTEKLPIYREIIGLALGGMIPNNIAIHLNDKGILTNRGNHWSGMAVQRLLVDETHLGKIISNKTQGDAHKNKRPNSKDYRILPRSEWTIVENCHEAVKTQEEHDAIIKMIDSRTLIPHKSRKQIHVFTGLIKCAICGRAQTFQKRSDGILIMKPCWYIDKHGNKCKNAGIKLSVIEEMVLKEIGHYREQILSATTIPEDVSTENLLKEEILESERMLDKIKRALGRLNDAYEMGDYSRDEWLERKKRREAEVYNLNKKIYELQKKDIEKQEITDDERLERLEAFFDFFPTSTSNLERNTLYKTIIESIIWFREGENIEMKINFL